MMVKKDNVYPVVDLFAGPGGLGEGFASLRQFKNKNRYAFKTFVSIEKDVHAHCTLQLRHFYREFSPNNVTDDYCIPSTTVPSFSHNISTNATQIDPTKQRREVNPTIAGQGLIPHGTNSPVMAESNGGSKTTLLCQH